MRAISTVLDTGLFLLLVGVALLTLTVPGDPARTDASTADETAGVLATATADVEYSLAPGAERARDDVVAFPYVEGVSFERRTHGTLADHLATAAVGTATVHDERVTHHRTDYRRAVTEEVRSVTRGRDTLVHVRANWEPYPGAPVAGELTVGPTPPPTADVHAATIAVDSGVASAEVDAERAAASGGYDVVAEVVATRTVEGLFPPAQTRDALLGPYPTDRLVEYRYRRFASLVGADVGPHLRRNDVAAANDELAAALAEDLAADMDRRFASPSAAAEAVAVDTVRITVRTWEP